MIGPQVAREGKEDVFRFLREHAIVLAASSPLWADSKDRAQNPWRRPSGPRAAVLTLSPDKAQEVLDICQTEAAGRFVRVLPEMDMALFPPDAPLAAWLILGFYPLVRAFHRVKGDSTIKDSWTRAFRAAAMAWGPVHPDRGVFERLNEEEERLAHLGEVSWDWWQFCDAVHAHKAPDVLPSDCVILLPVLNVPPEKADAVCVALKVLAHPKVVWLISVEDIRK
jgi:hypothetical protein